MMMEWGLKIADKMALPVFVESTEDGEQFYRKNDFDVIETLQLDAPIANQSPEFEQVRAKLMPVPYFVMARPLGGKKADTNALKPSNGVKQTNGARAVTTENVISSASFSDFQFLNCSFANCHFDNCSITNGSIFIESKTPVKVEVSATIGHATSENGQHTNGISV
jgi:hypothetical protein